MAIWKTLAEVLPGVVTAAATGTLAWFAVSEFVYRNRPQIEYHSVHRQSRTFEVDLVIRNPSSGMMELNGIRVLRPTPCGIFLTPETGPRTPAEKAGHDPLNKLSHIRQIPPQLIAAGDAKEVHVKISLLPLPDWNGGSFRLELPIICKARSARIRKFCLKVPAEEHRPG